MQRSEWDFELTTTNRMSPYQDRQRCWQIGLASELRCWSCA
jgi:hypothetical protein